MVEPGRTLATRLTLNRWRQLRFSLMELLPQLPQPRVVVADRLLKKLPPLLVEQIWLIRNRDTGRVSAA